jgi:hypothetical protein
MRFLRLRSPSYGWNAFGWDIAIVAIGVALAIGVERLVQRYYWQQDARQASQAIKAELAEHQLDAIERLAVQPCLKQQLSALHNQLVNHSGGQWSALPMKVKQQATQTAAQRVMVVAYRAPIRPWRTEAWETARSSGALNHLPSQEIRGYAQAYHRSREMLAVQAREDEAAARLSALAFDGVLDTSSRILLLGTLAEIDNANSILEIDAELNLQLLRKLLNDLPTEPADQAIAHRLEAQRSFRGSCVDQLRLKRG